MLAMKVDFSERKGPSQFNVIFCRTLLEEITYGKDSRALDIVFSFSTIIISGWGFSMKPLCHISTSYTFLW